MARSAEPSDALQIVGLGVAYAALGVASQQLSLDTGSITVVWPAGGLALGALLARGLRLWPGVLLGAAITEVARRTPTGSALLVIASETVAAVVSAWLLSRSPSFDKRLARVGDVVALVAVGSLIGGGLGALGRGAAVAVFETRTTIQAAAAALSAHAMGVITVAPLLLVRGTPWRSVRRGEWLVWLGLLALACAVSFGGVVAGARQLPLGFASFPVLVAVGLRLGMQGAAVAVPVAAALSLLGTLAGHGPFARSDTFETIALLWSFTAIEGLTTLLFAASMVERHVAEIELSEREARMRAVFDAASDGIVTVDGRGRLEACNRSAEVMFGYAPGELYGEALSRLLVDADRARIDQILGAGGADRGAYDLVGRRADGQTFPLSMGVGSVETAGGSMRTLVLHDTTLRTRLEATVRQSQKMEAVGTLASGVAHDFNNLLMGIIGCAELSLASLDDRQLAREYLEQLKHAALGGRSIVSQLLAFSRKREGQPRPLQVDAIIAHNQGVLRRLVGDEVALELDLGAGDACVVIGPGHIEQILMNLVVNSRHAMPRGGTITIRTEVADAAHDAPAAGSYVVLSVSDDGAGMDAATQARAFDPFFTTKDVGSGTGLGLATVHGLVERAKGHVELRSAVGEGTTLTFHFPRAEADGEALAEPPPPPLRAHGRVLLVEDEPLVRRSVQSALERVGLEVVAAGDGRSAIEACGGSEQPFDMLLSDVRLPGMGGPEIARRVQQAFPAMEVVFMSAQSSDVLCKLGHLESADVRLLQKPFTDQELLRLLAERAPRLFDAAVPGSNGAGSLCHAPDAPSILVVDDEHLTRKAMAMLLGDAYQVVAVGSAEAALAAARERPLPFDVVLTDIGLPDIRGDRLAARLRRDHGATEVVYLSGRDAADPELAEALRQPRTSYATKPIDFEELERTLSRIVTTRGAATEASCGGRASRG